jgi:hypothetical protein
LAERILEGVTSSEELRRTCAELFHGFIAAADLEATTGDTLCLPTGLALAPDLAAQCILDTNRTVAFIRGLSLALDEARRRFPVGVLEVVYAGTGPFAPLVLPLMTARALRDVRFTFLDINRRSTEIVEGLIARLGLGERIPQVICCDATGYDHPTSIHVVVTETMQRALSAEPFVGIVRNLRRQLAPRGILVPERVTVDLALIDAREEKARWSGAAPPKQHDRLIRLFEVTAKGDYPSLDTDGRSESVFVTLPQGTPDLERWVALVTRIDVFGPMRLGDYESGLTMPEILWPLSPARGGEVIQLNYVLDSAPGIRWSRRSNHCNTTPAAFSCPVRDSNQCPRPSNTRWSPL